MEIPLLLTKRAIENFNTITTFNMNTYESMKTAKTNLREIRVYFNLYLIH